MKYEELLKRLAAYDGNWDDEVIFVDYQQNKSSFLYGNYKAYHINAVGFSEIDGKCILNNIYD